MFLKIAKHFLDSDAFLCNISCFVMKGYTCYIDMSEVGILLYGLRFGDIGVCCPVNDQLMYERGLNFKMDAPKEFMPI